MYVHADGDMTELSKSLFDDEHMLQNILADNPDILPGEELISDSSQNWALIAQETDVPDKEGGGERWSADHLFVDQDAIPTIVEVKRSDDTRIRRRVVGQMLDYASHARKYWESDGLRTRFEDTQADTAEEAYDHLGVGTDSEPEYRQSVERFWTEVESNLRNGNLRLLFVADEMPRELREIVEYLNEQMRDTEVLAVEVTRYEGEAVTAYSPSLYGKTAGGDKGGSRSGSSPPSYEGDDFLGDVDTKEDAGDITTEEAEAMREIYRFIREEADDFEFGGHSNVTVIAKWDAVAGSVFSISSSGAMPVWMADGNLDETGDRYEAVHDWYDRLKELDPASDPEEKGRIYVEALTTDTKVEEFEEACRELVARCARSTGEA